MAKPITIRRRLARREMVLVWGVGLAFAVATVAVRQFKYDDGLKAGMWGRAAWNCEGGVDDKVTQETRDVASLHLADFGLGGSRRCRWRLPSVAWILRVRMMHFRTVSIGMVMDAILLPGMLIEWQMPGAIDGALPLPQVWSVVPIWLALAIPLCGIAVAVIGLYGWGRLLLRMVRRALQFNMSTK